ncbi:MAG TPA: aminotransferase class IV [Lentimicrobium sp.]|nr:aminotransferase class IV [Lentimicrobium sp.]
MFPFFETVKIQNGIPYNLKYHQDRIRKTLGQHFKSFVYQPHFPDLEQIFNKVGKEHSLGLYKGKIYYNSENYELSIEPYHFRQIKSLKVIFNDNIDYPYKYTDRYSLDALLKLKDGCDDILIIKNGNVTDTSFTNIAFFDGDNWYTPDTPLLPGTAKTRLIENLMIRERRITFDEIKIFRGFKLINSMLDEDFMEFNDINEIIF